MNISFKVFIPDINETAILNEKPQKLVKRLSYKKALVAKKEFKNDFILSADTIVYARKKIIGKTKNRDIAKLNLKTLSGRRHRVFTGITFLKDHDIYFQYICMSIIKFRILSTKEIDHYLTLNQWKDCAGSYSIQGFAESFVEMISGSYSNVIGLPMHITYKILRNNNLI